MLSLKERSGEVGWSEDSITSIVGTAQLVAGILGLTVGGWIGDRLGGLMMMFVLVFGLHFIGMIIMLTVRFPRSVKFEADVAAQLAEGTGPPPMRD